MARARNRSRARGRNPTGVSARWSSWASTRATRERSSTAQCRCVQPTRPFSTRPRPRTRQPPPGGIPAALPTSGWIGWPGWARSQRGMTRPVRRSVRASRSRSQRTGILCTVDVGPPVCIATVGGPRRFDRRSRHTRCSTRFGVRVGDRCGFDDRSSRPASPSAGRRRRHFDTVARDTDVCCATWACGGPAATGSTMIRRPVGVRRASRCIRASEARDVFATSTLPRRLTPSRQQPQWPLHLDVDLAAQVSEPCDPGADARR